MTMPAPDVARLIERLYEWRETFREQLPIGVGSLLKEAADALTALQDNRDAWALLATQAQEGKEAAEAREATLRQERDKWGPVFLRDLARLLGLPDDASMDQIASEVEALRQAQDRFRKALVQISAGAYREFDGGSKYAHEVAIEALASVDPLPQQEGQ